MHVLRIRKIFDEIARGLNLDRTLAFIATQVAAEVGAPTCKIWVVKHGDICHRCVLATTCTNRDICMHLVAASGAAIDKEYPRLPLSIFNAPMISRGGTASFTEPGSLGDKLFGLQHGANEGGRDSYALAPLKGASGIIGLIGIFNHRSIEPEDLETLDQFTPAAVAAIRVAELQARCDTLRNQNDTQTAMMEAAEQHGASNQLELERGAAAHAEALSRLEHALRETANRLSESLKKVDTLEAEKVALALQLKLQVEQQQESAHTYSEWAGHAQSDLLTAETKIESLSQQVSALKEKLADSDGKRKSLASEIDRLKSEIISRSEKSDALGEELSQTKSELFDARTAHETLSGRLTLMIDTNTRLREHSAAVSDSMDDFEQSLRFAEDARARLERERLELSARAAALFSEIDQLRAEKAGMNVEAEHLGLALEELREKERTLLEKNAKLEDDLSLFRERLAASEEARLAILKSEQTLAEENGRLKNQANETNRADVDHGQTAQTESPAERVDALALTEPATAGPGVDLAHSEAS